MIRPYFGSHFVLKTPAPVAPTRAEFGLRAEDPLGDDHFERPYDFVKTDDGRYSEITSVLDENDPKVESFLKKLGIAYEVTASAKAYLIDWYSKWYKEDYPEADEWTVAHYARNFTEEYIEDRRDCEP